MSALLGVDACRRLAVDRLLGGGLRALARVERGVERLAVVALVDRLAGALERVLGGGELVAGVLIGAGGAGGVDGALRLLHFFVGGIAARRAGDRRDDGERQQQATRSDMGSV